MPRARARVFVHAWDQPVVIRGYASAWPAVSRWRDLNEFAERAETLHDCRDQPLLVPVEVGGEKFAEL
jgi:hypothetical protein